MGGNEPQSAAVADDRHLELSGLVRLAVALHFLEPLLLLLLKESLVERKNGGVEEGVHALLDLLLRLAARRPVVERIGQVAGLDAWRAHDSDEDTVLLNTRTREP